MAPLFTLYVTVVLGVAVTERLDADPEQIGLAPEMAKVATGKGTIVITISSSTAGQATVV